MIRFHTAEASYRSIEREARDSRVNYLWTGEKTRKKPRVAAYDPGGVNREREREVDKARNVAATL